MGFCKRKKILSTVLLVLVALLLPAVLAQEKVSPQVNEQQQEERAQQQQQEETPPQQQEPAHQLRGQDSVPQQEEPEHQLPQRPYVPKEEGKEEEPEELYMYDENAGVVIEYMPPKDAHDPRRPDFLYSADQGFRVVEFYAPWCPHCQDFRDHYVEFAAEITNLAAMSGVRNLDVYGVSCEAHVGLCRDWKIKGFPQLRIFKAGHANYTARVLYRRLDAKNVLKQLGIRRLANQTMTQEGMDSIAAKLAARAGDAKQAKVDRKAREEASMVAALTYKRTKDDISNDAYLSFHFAMRNGIFMTNDALSTRATNSLANWIDVIYHAIPPTYRIHSLARALREDFANAIRGEDYMLNIMSAYPPINKRWSLACTKGKKAAGYTCGLWELFHILTLGVVEWNELALASGDFSKAIGVEDVAVAIRNYIDLFFGCEVCRMNFVKAFDSCAHHRCERLDNNARSSLAWRELPLWLFETHNSVNVRLMKERAERDGRNKTTLEDEYAVTWPSREDCPQCWREDGAWDEHEVYRQLRKDYWPNDSSFLLTMRRDLFRKMKVEEDDDEKEFEGDDAVGALEEEKKEELEKEGVKVDIDETNVFSAKEEEAGSKKEPNGSLGTGEDKDIGDEIEQAVEDFIKDAGSGETSVEAERKLEAELEEVIENVIADVVEEATRDEEKSSQLAFYLVPLGASSTVLAVWAFQKARRRRSGLGKKTF